MRERKDLVRPHMVTMTGHQELATPLHVSWAQNLWDAFHCLSRLISQEPDWKDSNQDEKFHSHAGCPIPRQHSRAHHSADLTISRSIIQKPISHSPVEKIAYVISNHNQVAHCFLFQLLQGEELKMQSLVAFSLWLDLCRKLYYEMHYNVVWKLS